VKEVVRQLRLRDIGGIIVIDFIDMANPKNRATVEEALRSELERDRTKTYVVEISPLGLVEMTRQNVTDGPREILTTKCVVCAGDGFVVSEATHALEIERMLREIAKGARAQAFRIAVHPRVLALLAGPGGNRLQEIEAVARRRFFLVPAASENGHVHLGHFEVQEQGKLESLKPAAPVEEGDSLELKLVEVGLYDPTAGVGKIDGSEVVVAGAAKLVGKKVTVSVGRVLDGVAFATLADTADAASPITFEAEAEKPTRAPSRRKTSTTEPVAEAVPEESAEEPSEEPEELAAVGEPEDTAVAEGDAVGETPKKKRTRRGTRGGRGRKKPATATATAAEQVTPERDGRKTTPRIHVPSPDLAVEPEPEREPDAESEPSADATAEVEGTVDGQPKRKRSRRGTRGGRKRKKPAANGGTPEEAEPADTADVAVAVAEESPAEYVPMSEWIEDFDSRSPRKR
jgi:ribonuclease G